MIKVLHVGIFQSIMMQNFQQIFHDFSLIATIYIPNNNYVGFNLKFIDSLCQAVTRLFSFHPLS